MKNKSIRTSSVESFIAEKIVMENEISTLGIIALLATLTYEKEDGMINFLPLRQL